MHKGNKNIDVVQDCRLIQYYFGFEMLNCLFQNNFDKFIQDILKEKDICFSLRTLRILDFLVYYILLYCTFTLPNPLIFIL